MSKAESSFSELAWFLAGIFLGLETCLGFRHLGGSSFLPNQDEALKFGSGMLALVCVWMLVNHYRAIPYMICGSVLAYILYPTAVHAYYQGPIGIITILVWAALLAAAILALAHWPIRQRRSQRRASG